MKFTEIKYKCFCEDKEHALHIPERMENEEIESFMYRAQIAITANHLQNKPWCGQKTMEYAMIMYDPNTGKAGGAPVTH